MTYSNSNEPRLSVEPEQLDFGAYQPRLPLSRQPILTLKISNEGGGSLHGRLIRQVSWIILRKYEFHCPEGETSLHTVQISTGAPQVVIRERYHIEQLILVDSNAGSKTIGGSYSIGLTSRSNFGKFVILALSILVLLVASVILLNGNLTHILPVKPRETNHQILFTSGAETFLAKITQSATSAEVRQPSHSITPTQKKQIQNTAALQTPSQNAINTNTPWPRAAFPNPEEVVSKYYREINAGQYEAAWSMLSEHFQQTCCAISGNDPFTIYSMWWSHNIEKVEVNSAYLQDWDANPAPVLVSISYYYKNGKIEDMIFMHYLIADVERETLIIDEVR